MLPAKIIIGKSPVSTNADGLISLTDLWKAAGRANKKQPKLWLLNDSTQEFIDSVAGKGGGRKSYLAVKRGGHDQGTYAHWQIALALDPDGEGTGICLQSRGTKPNERFLYRPDQTRWTSPPFALYRLLRLPLKQLLQTDWGDYELGKHNVWFCRGNNRYPSFVPGNMVDVSPE
jgi:hypothetical protein